MEFKPHGNGMLRHDAEKFCVIIATVYDWAGHAMCHEEVPSHSIILRTIVLAEPVENNPATPGALSFQEAFTSVEAAIEGAPEAAARAIAKAVERKRAELEFMSSIAVEGLSPMDLESDRWRYFVMTPRAF